MVPVPPTGSRPAVPKGTDPDLSSGQPMGVLADTQTMGQSRQGARHQGEAGDLWDSSILWYLSSLSSSQSTYTHSPGLKVTGCEINWAVNSIFQQMNYPESLF